MAHIKCDVINPLECQLIVDNKKSIICLGSIPIPSYDAVLPRIGASITDYGLAVVNHFEIMGVTPINSAQAIAVSRDKLKCSQLLAQVGLKIPKTILTRNLRGLRGLMDQVQGFPTILKVPRGTQGLGVMLLNTPIALRSVFETLRGLDQDVMIQRFVREAQGRDYRVFVIGNKVIASMVRTAAEGDFRSNLHRGGEGQPCKIPPNYAKSAIKAAKTLGLEIAGVDLIESRDGPMVLEVNSSPGFEGIEKATGLNIGAAIVKHIKKLM